MLGSRKQFGHAFQHSVSSRNFSNLSTPPKIFRSFNAADSFNAIYPYRDHSIFKLHLRASTATSGSLPTNLPSRLDVLLIYDCDFAPTRPRPPLLIFLPHLLTFPRRQSRSSTTPSTTTSLPSGLPKFFIPRRLLLALFLNAFSSPYSSTPSPRHIPLRLLSERLNIT